jgi:hypothetical protein
MSTRTAIVPLVIAALLLLGFPASAGAQFRDDFEQAPLPADPAALEGWAFFTGDGLATINLTTARGVASIRVDATKDRDGIWWSLIRRCVSAPLDLARLAEPATELRIEARVRTPHAPKRINLHFNTQRTTDFHSHLREYDLAEPDTWYTISMTTRDFDGRPGDRVCAQVAVIDWGLEIYRLDVDYVRVDVVDTTVAAPDLGEPLEYRPPVRHPGEFAHAVSVAHDSTIDRRFPEMNFNDWIEARDGTRSHLLAVNGTQFTILRWDLREFAGHKAAGSGLLTITTHAVQRPAERTKDFGQVRVVEILHGDPQWDQQVVTGDSLFPGNPPHAALNSQMIIDVTLNDPAGGQTLITINRPVMQRLLDGRTLGIAIIPLGAINASFLAIEQDGGARAAKLYFNLAE